MAKEFRTDVETMRAAGTERQRIADQLKAALDEGRLSLHEYDDRVGPAYAARTYKDLLVPVADLPRPGLSATNVNARLPTALLVLWTIWGALTAVNLVTYVLVRLFANGDIHPWPVRLTVPAATLATVTVGVQVIRHQQRRY